MENLANTWGLYSFYPNLEKHYKYIHPNDLESFKALFPYGLVFFCVSEDGDYICLSYGKFKARVKPDLYRKVEADGYFIEDIVEILNGSSQGKKARIQEMIWHYKKPRVFYQLEVDGKIKSKRYWKEDFKLFVDS